MSYPAVSGARERLELGRPLERLEHRVGLEPAPHLHGIRRDRLRERRERLRRLPPERVERRGVVVEEEVLGLQRAGLLVRALRLRVEPLLRVADAEIEPRLEVLRLEAHDLLQLADRGAVVALVHLDGGELVARERVLRGELDGAAQLLRRLLELVLVREGEGEVDVRVGGGRVELDRLLELLDRLVEPAAVGELDPPRVVRVGERDVVLLVPAHGRGVYCLSPRAGRRSRWSRDLTGAARPARGTEERQARHRPAGRPTGSMSPEGRRRMALYTVLSDAELAAALRAFGLPAPERVRPEPRGGVNTNYHVWSGGRRLFLRVNEGKAEADVRFEAEVLRFLEAARYPVAPLLPAADGRPFVPVAGRPAMLFAYAAGEEVLPDGVTPERCRRIGEQLARLHDLSAGFPGERPNPYGPARVAAWLAAL